MGGIKEDEIKIDFNKVKEFNTKEEDNSSPNNMSEDKITNNQYGKNEDEINIDFSKIKNKLKNFFSSKEEKNEQDDISFEFSRITNFVKKYPTLCVLLLLIILQFMPNYGFLPWGGIYMRMLNEDLPRIDVIAKDNVYAFYKNQIIDAVNKQSPNLPPLQKNNIVEEQFNIFLKQNEKLIEQQINQLSETIKEHYRYDVDGKKYTYMPDIDPYAYLRYAQNILDKGIMSDFLINGTTPYDNYTLAPIGSITQNNFHSYFLAYLYKILSFFDKKISLMQSSSYFPIIFILLSIIPAFYIGKRFTNNFGGFVTGSILMIHAILIGRTQWGHADTDAYNVFFPLFILWIFIETLNSKNIKKRYLLTILMSFIIGLYSFAWGGWWFILDFIIATIIIFLLFLIVNNSLLGIYIFKDDKIRSTTLFFMFFLIMSGIFVSIFSGYDTYINALKVPLNFIKIKDVAHTNLWPNVYTTVAELSNISISEVIYDQIGIWFTILSLIGVIILPLKELINYYKKRKEFNEIYFICSILLIVWFVATFYSTTKGIRFTMLLVPALSISLGIIFGLLYKYNNVIARMLYVPEIIIRPSLIILLLLVMIPIATEGYAASLQDIPIVNDAWWNVLIKIKAESSQNAIITSWWDYGHHFKYISNRSVTFDGGTQNTPLAYWVGKLLLTSNEDESIAILRMINCGSNKAFETLDNIKNDVVKSVEIINNILMMNFNDARVFLINNGVNDPETILKYTHCNPPESFLITSGDMIKKAGVWAHFGGWNFEKVDLLINAKNFPRDQAIKYIIDKYNYSNSYAEKYYYEMQNINLESDSWISPWPLFVSSRPSRCFYQNEKSFVCENGFVLDNGVGRLLGKSINSMVYINKNKQYEYRLLDNSSELSALIIPTDDDQITSIITSPELVNSIFTRLYFMKGHGLKHFKLFTVDNELISGPLYVWKVDWTGNQSNFMSELVDKERVEEGSMLTLNFIGWLDNGTIFDSTIVDWPNINITKDSNFSDFITQPRKIYFSNSSILKDFYDLLKNRKKGDEFIMKIKSDNELVPENVKIQTNNSSLNIKFRIEKIK